MGPPAALRHLPLLLAGLVVGLPARAQQGGEKEVIQARALFDEANKRMDRGDYPGAVELYQEAFRRYPENPKTLVNLGTAYKRWGKNAAAANAYQQYLDHVKSDPDKHSVVEALLKELDAKVAMLSIVVEEPGATVRLDGEDLGVSPRRLTRRVEAGPHLVAAEKEGFTPSQANVTVAVGDVREVQLRLIQRSPGSGRGAPPVDDADAVIREPVDRSHRGRFGVFARVDVDGNEIGRGAGGVAGGSFGLGNRLEVSLGGIVGPNFGVWGGATAFLATGRWKPLLTLGVPLYFLDSGPLAGLHAAAGLQWDPTRSLGLYLTVGLQVYFGPPDEMATVAFVPSLGAQLRL